MHLKVNVHAIDEHIRSGDNITKDSWLQFNARFQVDIVGFILFQQFIGACFKTSHTALILISS